MKKQLCILSAMVVTLLVGAPSGAAAAKVEQWSDGQGNTFRGSPAEVMGPFALFQTDRNTGRRVLLRLLSAEDCVRFHRALPAGAGETVPWAQATGTVTREVPGNVSRLNGEKLEPVDMAKVPEPRLLMLLCFAGSSDRFRDFVEECAPAYQRMQAAHPGILEALYLSARRSPGDHLGLARGTNMPWLIVDFDRIASMSKTKRLIPSKDQWLWVVNRDGVPVVSTAALRAPDVEKAITELETLLVLMRPGNPRIWQDRLHYYRAVHAAEHQQGKADPLLIGNPVDAAELRGVGVNALEATIQVAADGSVTAVEITPGGPLTEEIAASVGTALRRAAFVPAVDRGTFVDGTYRLRMMGSAPN